MKNNPGKIQQVNCPPIASVRRLNEREAGAVVSTR
jgi:hypothetical protein